ncbi:tail fiber domain-containing protein [Roseivirga pacifica]|uniref:tail fiber domain-containing protein n=1 Tax=Roseivirga pacifica TaxID=1267423 RepID=UPI00227D325A|nr:tail fiber domain-containing protein [Roseivirga pacifica]
MKRFAAFAVLFFILSCHAIRAQVGIGSEEFVPDESSILELRSDSKGLLIPRLTRDQRDRMDNPSTGLLIYQTDLESGFYFYNGEKWVSILASDGTIVQDYQSIAFDPVTYMLTLENGGQVDLSVLRFGRSLEQTVDNGDGTITFNYNDGTSFTTIDLRGSKGDKGDDGLDGRTILSGSTDPNLSEGSEGDFYINTASSTFFGPKTNTGWGTGTSLKGDQGPAGVNGADGIDGTNGTDGVDGKDGNSFLNGTGAPAATLGQDGDFYVDTNANTYYGPKTAGAWGTAISLVGPAGADGADGTNGTDGVDGKDGNSFLNGAGAPAATLGQDGDFYVDTNANTYYGPKTAGAWGAPTSLVGSAGTNGADGTNGTDGVDGKDGNSFLNGTGAPAATLGQDGDFYVDTNANTYYGPKTAGAWGAATSLVGPAGADGADGVDGTNGTDGVDGKDGNSFLNGTGAPAATLGQDGDFYVDTNANNYYGPKTAGAWGTATSLVGPAGADGADGIDGTNGTDGVDGKDGNSFLNGTGAPAATLGQDGDFYVDTNANTYYGPKTAGAWGAPTSLVGPAGADGADGTNGTDGIDGKDGNSFLNGTGAPAATLGQDGDFYVDTNANTYYGPKTAGAWGTPTSLVGPAGADGADGIDGTNGTDGVDGINGTDGVDGKSMLNGTGAPAPTLGNNGDFYIDTNSNNIYGPKTAGTWGAATSLIGPAGADGTDGTNGTDGIDGKSMLNGTGAPAATLGIDGDIYFDTDANAVYGPKAAGAWGAATSLVGPAGADGADGTDGIDGIDGSSILSGTSNPVATNGTDGDFYINTSSLQIFGPKTGGAWGTATPLQGNGIQSTMDNPDGSITFTYTDGTSFTTQPDGDFSTTNELITGIALVNKTLQIREAGITKTVDLSPVSTTSKLVDTDLNTTIDVDEGGFNDDIIRFTVGGAEKMRLTGRTLEVLNNSSSINIGKDAGINGTGAGNILLGDEAAYANTSGNNNIAIGYRALRQNSTGTGNVAIGYYAGYNETGNNKLYIENSNNPNPLIWGDFSKDVVNVNGKLGIGLLNPGGITNELEVNGHATVISLTETSDKRFKQNIEVITNPIDAIKLINGIRYDWRIDEFPNRRFKTGKNIGFIAQEVQAVFPELVSESSDGYLSVSYSGMTPILVEAVKDQQETIESQAQTIDELKTMLLELKKETEKLSEEVSKLKEANATKDK